MIAARSAAASLPTAPAAIEAAPVVAKAAESLAPVVQDLRAAGQSGATIARTLAQEHGIPMKEADALVQAVFKASPRAAPVAEAAAPVAAAAVAPATANTGSTTLDRMSPEELAKMPKWVWEKWRQSHPAPGVDPESWGLNESVPYRRGIAAAAPTASADTLVASGTELDAQKLATEVLTWRQKHGMSAGQIKDLLAEKFGIPRGQGLKMVQMIRDSDPEAWARTGK